MGVKIVSGGVGYTELNTRIDINLIGTGAKLKPNLKSWTVNDVERYGLSNIEDGKIFGNGYSLNKNTFGVYFLNQRLRNFLNITSTQHSPIVGWAYDGCPIYGPYAFENPDGTGNVIKMRSGYSYQNAFDSDFKFVEEYIFTNSGTLDRYNGRFCVTPQYPNGVYAYFCTLDNNNSPQYPYVIGPQYNSAVIEDNLDLKINQSKNFNTLNISKWTLPYRIDDYEHFVFFKGVNKKDIFVQKSSTGFVDEVKILNGGLNYAINDSLSFDDEGTSGFGVIAKVSELSGVGITTIRSQTTTFSQVTFVSDGSTVVGIASTYHSFVTGSYVNISGISTDSLKPIEGFRKITVPNIVTKLKSNLGPSTITGIVTSIQISSSISFFDINSQLQLENEIVTVIGQDYKNNLLNILRSPGSPSHSEFESISLLQNKFSFFGNNVSPLNTEIDQTYYFNSSEAVSIGSTLGVGFGNTLSIYPLGFGVPYVKYVPTGGIYLPNHKFNTGDKLTYAPGSSTIVTNLGNLDSLTQLYVLKLSSDVIGIVTSKSNLSNQNQILTYTGTGTGNLHKFTSNRNVVTGTATRNICVVSTASTHNLSVNDVVNLNVKSGIAVTFTVTYSNNRTLINSQTNPEVNVYSNDVVIFDLSDASMNGKEFNLYTDENFLNPYVGNTSNDIEVSKSSTSLILRISDFTPNNLFYNVTNSNNDRTVNNYNQLNIKKSKYNTESTVTSVSSYEFTIDLNDTPERSSYTQNSSIISYTISKSSALGPISKIKLLSK